MDYLIILESKEKSADVGGALAQLYRFNRKGVEVLLIMGGVGNGTTRIWVLVSLRDDLDVVVKADMGELTGFDTSFRHKVRVLVAAKAKRSKS